MYKRIASLCPLLFCLITATPAAEVFELDEQNFGERPGGKEADSIVGDFVLRSTLIEAVVSGNLTLRRANMGAYYGEGKHSPGCLYDLTTRGAANDQLTVFSPCSRWGNVSYVRSLGTDASGVAAVEVFISAETSGRGVEETHLYQVRDDWPGVLISTTFQNRGSAAIQQNIYDHWTQMRAQGEVRGIRWADAIDPADKGAYAFGWMTDRGAVDPVPRIVSRANRQDFVQLEPGETFRIARFVAVGNSPAQAIGRVARQQKREVAEVSWKMNKSQGDDSSLEAAELVIKGEDNAVIKAYPDRDGLFRFDWFAGKHQMELADRGRESVTRQVEFTAGTTFSESTEMSPQSRVRFSITSSGMDTPCKAQFLAEDGSAKLDLGPTDRAHGCVDQWHSATGSFEVALPPGNYRVVVTRGPEFSRHEQKINLGKGEVATVTAALTREVDSSGWISADFHNHSTPSGDNTCGTRDRLINLAAEQIEFAPTTEHNRLFDWAPLISELKLGPFLNTVPGMELTGSGAHLNCFPLKPEPFKQDSGAPTWVRDPRINALNLQNWQQGDPDRWIQINHPDMSENFVDRDRDGEADGGFTNLSAFINAVETQNYSDSQILSKAPFEVTQAKTGLGKQVSFFREFIWLQLLNHGSKVWGVAVADAHHVYGNGVGSWRTYLPSGTDEPDKIDWREISRNARLGRMVLSSGPFLTVATEKGSIAGAEETSSSPVQLKVRVQCPSWMDFDRVQVLVNGRQLPEYNYTKASHPDKFRDGVVRFDETLAIALKEDSHLIVVALAENGNLAALYGTSSQAKIRPCAYNNPIFIDVDGNGFKANGDNLGYELPVGNLSAQKVEALLGR